MKGSRLLVASALALAACSQDGGRELAPYYDPLGYFTAELPAANALTVTPPRPAEEGPGLLTGVIAQPPAPSPQPQGGLGAFDFAQTEEQDQTVYQVLAVTTGEFEDLQEMGLYFLTGDPAIDVQLDDPTGIDGHQGRLLVADVTNGGQLTASIAVAMTLGEGGTGFLIAAIFPPGDWEKERADFHRVLESFRGDVPPGIETFPVTGGGA